MSRGDSIHEASAGSDAPKPSTALAALAAAAPVVFCPVASVVALAYAQGDVVSHIQEMGVFFYVVTAATAVGCLTLAVTLFLAGRGARVPSAVALGAAGFPWVAGVAGMRSGTHMVAEAVANAPPDVRATLMAAGISEASQAHLYGTWMGSALLSGAAFGFAVAALAQRPPNRRVLGAGLAVLALPLLGLCLLALAGDAGRAALLPALPAAGGLVAVALAGAAAGHDAPHGRAASLAAAAPVALVLAFVAAALSARDYGQIDVFRALAMVSPGDRLTVLGHAAHEMSGVASLSTHGLLAGVLPVAGVAGWAASRSRPSLGGILGGAAVVFAGASLIGLDLAAAAGTGAQLAAVGSSPWGTAPGFVPVRAEGPTRDEPVDLLLAPSAVFRPDGSAAGVPDRGSLAAALRAALRARENDLFRGFGRLGGLDTPEPEVTDCEPPEEPSVTVALHEGLTATHLRELLHGARAAGVRRLVLVGQGAEDLSPEALAEIVEVMPLFASLSGPTVAGVSVVVADDALGRCADADPRLAHLVVGAAVPPELAGRAGAGPTELPRGPLDPWDRDRMRTPGPESSHAWLAIGDGATVASVLAVAARAESAGLEPVLSPDGVPGRPAEAPRPPEAGVLGTLDHSLLRALEGALGDDPVAAIGRLGDLGDAGSIVLRGGGTGGVAESGNGGAVQGSLSREVIQRVVRSRLPGVRRCYERGLATRPDLEGQVRVRFVVGPTGAVSEAAVEGSTLGATGVEECVTQEVGRWRFPAPEGGGVVVVRYPFDFRPASD